MTQNIIKIEQDGNCLFRAISYIIYKTQDRHREIRLQAVSRIVNEWEFYKHFVIDLTLEEYKNLLSRDGEFGSSMELTSISNLFPDYLFRVHYVNNANTVDYGSGNIVGDLLFSGDYDAGHFDVLQNIAQKSSAKKYKKRKSLTGRRELRVKRTRYQDSRPFEAHYKCAMSYSSIKFDSYNIGTLSYTCKFCNALFFFFANRIHWENIIFVVLMGKLVYPFLICLLK